MLERVTEKEKKNGKGAKNEKCLGEDTIWSECEKGKAGRDDLAPQTELSELPCQSKYTYTSFTLT